MHFEAIGELVNGISTMIIWKNANDFVEIDELVGGISSMITRKSANDFESSFRALGWEWFLSINWRFVGN